MHLLIGLGNPGKDYDKTRHNIGFMVMDRVMEQYGLPASKKKFHAQLSEGSVDGHKILTLKPQTYMNRSGLSVGEALGFYKIPLEQVIVFHDDIDLTLGKLRIKTGGGAGGHNGLKDIDVRVGKDYKRVRIGVGHPGDKDQVSGHVLSRFSKEEEPLIASLVERMATHLPILLGGDDSLFLTRVSGV